MAAASIRESGIRRVLSAALCTAVVMLTAGCGPTKPTTQDNLAWADYELAKERNAKNLLMRADILVDRDQLDPALADLDAAVALDRTVKPRERLAPSEMEKVFLLRSRVHVLRGEEALARADVEFTLKTYHGSSQTFDQYLGKLFALYRGEWFLLLGRYDEAEEMAAAMMQEGPVGDARADDDYEHRLRERNFTSGWKLMAKVYQAR